MEKGYKLGLQMLVVIAILATGWITAAGAIANGLNVKEYFFIPVAAANVIASIIVAYKYAKSRDML